MQIFCELHSFYISKKYVIYRKIWALRKFALTLYVKPLNMRFITSLFHFLVFWPPLNSKSIPLHYLSIVLTTSGLGPNIKRLMQLKVCWSKRRPWKQRTNQSLDGSLRPLCFSTFHPYFCSVLQCTTLRYFVHSITQIF